MPAGNAVLNVVACSSIRRRAVDVSGSTRKRATPEQLMPRFRAMTGASRPFRSRTITVRPTSGTVAFTSLTAIRPDASCAGEQVDRTTFAVLGERHLDLGRPTGRPVEPDERIDDRRVVLVEGADPALHPATTGRARGVRRRPPTGARDRRRRCFAARPARHDRSSPRVVPAWSARSVGASRRRARAGSRRSGNIDAPDGRMRHTAVDSPSHSLGAQPSPAGRGWPGRGTMAVTEDRRPGGAPATRLSTSSLLSIGASSRASALDSGSSTPSRRWQRASSAFGRGAAGPLGVGNDVPPDVRGLHRYDEELALRFADTGSMRSRSITSPHAGLGRRDATSSIHAGRRPATWAGLSSHIRAAACVPRSSDAARPSTRSRWASASAAGSPSQRHTGHRAAASSKLLRGPVGPYRSGLRTSRGRGPDARPRPGHLSAGLNGGIGAGHDRRLRGVLEAAKVDDAAITYPARRTALRPKADESASTSDKAWREGSASTATAGSSAVLTRRASTATAVRRSRRRGRADVDMSLPPASTRADPPAARPGNEASSTSGAHGLRARPPRPLRQRDPVRRSIVDAAR